MKNIQELSLDETRELYRDYLKNQGYKQHTVMTSSSEAFYLWKHGSKEFFWMTVLSEDFKICAREAILKYLRKDSKGDPLRLINSYLFHLKKFRTFSLECCGSTPLKEQNTAMIRKNKILLTKELVHRYRKFAELQSRQFMMKIFGMH